MVKFTQENFKQAFLETRKTQGTLSDLVANLVKIVPALATEDSVKLKSRVNSRLNSVRKAVAKIDPVKAEKIAVKSGHRGRAPMNVASLIEDLNELDVDE